MEISYIVHASGIPSYADKIMFTADLVDYVCRKSIRQEDHLILTTIRYRDFVYNGFNETTKMAVNFISRVIEKSLEAEMQVMDTADPESIYEFFEILKRLRSKFFPNGFDLQYFLIYCVYVARYALYFYDMNFNSAPMVAVNSIVKLFRHYDMANGGWGVLHYIASVVGEVSPFLAINLPGTPPNLRPLTPNYGSPLIFTQRRADDETTKKE